MTTQSILPTIADDAQLHPSTLPPSRPRLVLTRMTLITVIALLSFATPVSTRAAEEETDLKIQTQFGRIIQADSWMGRKVFGQKGKLVGQTEDLALDLETGHLALVLVRLTGLDDEMPGFLAVPPASLREGKKGLRFRKNVDDSRLATASRLPESAYHRQLNRGWAEQQYKTFKQQPYWVRPVKSEGKELPDKPADQTPQDKEYLLTLVSNLRNKPINDEDGQKIGTIGGFAVSPKDGQVVYAAVQLENGETNHLYPVPLGAFLVGDPAQPWAINLDRKIIANTPGFASDDWPSKVERGWIEYVHVRYGRSAIGGVQSKGSTK